MAESALIVAANGRVASRVVKRLGAAETRPIALVRDGDKARTTLGVDGDEPNAELVIAELTDRRALESALARVDVAFLALGSSPVQAQLEKAVIDAASAVSLPHLVKLSAAYASTEASTSVLRVHADIEAHLVASGLNHTLISPTTFMEIALLGAASIAATGGWFGTAPAGTNALIDSEDVVDSVVAVLLDKATRGATHILTGPAALSWPDVANELSTRLGRPVSYDVVSIEERTRQLESAGLEAWRVELLLGIDELNRESLYREPNGTVLALTGHEPRTFSDFAWRHRNSFLP
ncbi:NmrA family NAD(P)-binding protein [Rhodococcoides fascians]|uniref:NmrA family NAD(P)-binding protein n=1 Tax=Rhodococcoides fascians TaxID=1828 RepID=UPI000B05FA53|nr:NAD(P)H-binding protein [Rhodococcus fascians]